MTISINIYKNTFVWKPGFMHKYYNGSKSHRFIIRWLCFVLHINYFPKDSLSFLNIKFHYYKDLPN